MSRLKAIQPQAATGKARELLDAVQAKLKMTPNMMKVMANSPAVLEAYLSSSGILANGALDTPLREAIALEVGEQNSCQYCVSAHTPIGKMTGLTGSKIQLAREARSGSARNAAALQFARELVAKKGRATDADVEAVCRAGFSDGEIAEIIASGSEHFHKLLQQYRGGRSRLPEDCPSAMRLGSRCSSARSETLAQL